MYKEGYRSKKDEPRGCRLWTSRTGENERHVRDLQNLDRRLNVCVLAEKLRMDKMIVRQIITEKLETRKICVKLVSKVLTDQKK